MRVYGRLFASYVGGLALWLSKPARPQVRLWGAPYRQSARAFAVQAPKPLAIMLRITEQT